MVAPVALVGLDAVAAHTGSTYMGRVDTKYPGASGKSSSPHTEGCDDVWQRTLHGTTMQYEAGHKVEIRRDRYAY